MKEFIFSCGFRWLVLVFSRGELSAHVTLYTGRSFLDVRIKKKKNVYFELFLVIHGAWNEMTNKGEYIMFFSLQGKNLPGNQTPVWVSFHLFIWRPQGILSPTLL